jgi:hypothetical protein
VLIQLLLRLLFYFFLCLDLESWVLDSNFMIWSWFHFNTCPFLGIVTIYKSLRFQIYKLLGGMIWLAILCLNLLIFEFYSVLLYSWLDFKLGLIFCCTQLKLNKLLELIHSLYTLIFHDLILLLYFMFDLNWLLLLLLYTLFFLLRLF